ncbi:EamA family transporter RarD [Mobilicoccus pelagius]|uniref:EamA family transporter RarD n=1 Tax=Mobilicoccus pelagius TaxID=746032 RepID=UPI001FE08601|nr:EamA family transporter RarD [Mobilicoccus pelagius]
MHADPIEGRPDTESPATGDRSRRTPAELGVLYGLGAYLLWGAMPLYFRLLAPAGAWEILAHRVVWSFVVCAALLLVRGRRLPTLRRPPRELLTIVLASLLIAANWITYVLAVTSGHVTEAALGYFLNPLVSIALGLVVLHEHLRPLQAIAIGIGAAGGLFLAVAGGHVPWIAFALAASFGTYGLVKKGMPADLGALGGLTAESAFLVPAAAVVLVALQVTGTSTLAEGPGHVALLASTGVVTAVPLLLFAMAARRVPLVTVGLLQFISPVLQFVTGRALGEHMTTARWVGFGIVWLALACLVLDSLQARRRGPLST